MWILIIAALIVYVLFYANDGSGRQYIPKSQKSYITHMMHSLGGMFQAWII